MLLCVLVCKWFSSLFLKIFTFAAFTTSLGKLFQVLALLFIRKFWRIEHVDACSCIIRCLFAELLVVLLSELDMNWLVNSTILFLVQIWYSWIRSPLSRLSLMGIQPRASIRSSYGRCFNSFVLLARLWTFSIWSRSFFRTTWLIS